MIRTSFRGEGCKQVWHSQGCRRPGARHQDSRCGGCNKLASVDNAPDVNCCSWTRDKTCAGRGNYSQAKLFFFSMFESEETRTVSCKCPRLHDTGPGRNPPGIGLSVEELRNFGHACPAMKIAESRLVGPSPGHDEISILGARVRVPREHEVISLEANCQHRKQEDGVKQKMIEDLIRLTRSGEGGSHTC